MRIAKFLFWSLMILACETSKVPTEERTTAITEKPQTRPAEDFNSFLMLWNVDSSFQIKRIKFPLEQDFLGPHDGEIGSIIYEDSTDWIMYINLTYQDKYHDGVDLEFLQDTIWDGSKKVTIQQRGDFSMPDTKWHVDYTFELIEDEWFLTYSADFGY